MSPVATTESPGQQSIDHASPGEALDKTNYEANYIKRLLKLDEIEPLDPLRCNGYLPDINNLYAHHRRGGPGQVRLIIDQNYRRSRPDLIALIGEQPPSKIHFMHARELYEVPPVEYLYKKFIVKGGLSLLYAPPKIGKSFLAVHWSLEVAQHHTVIYTAPEGFRGYADRVKAWTTYHNKPEGELYFIQTPIPLMSNAGMDEWITESKRLNPALIVIDTLARSMVGGDENSSQDMGIVVDHCRRLQQELDCAVLIIHHSAKMTSRERGSTALPGAVDLKMKLDNIDGTLKLSCDETKDDAPFDDIFIRLMQVPARGDRKSCIVMPADKVTTTGHITPAQRMILEFLALDIHRANGATSAVIKTEVEIGSRSIYNVLNNLKKAGYVSQGPRGNPYKITAEGINVLKPH